MAGNKAEPLQVVHPESAGIDVGKRKHYVGLCCKVRLLG